MTDLLDHIPRATSCEWPLTEDHKGVNFCGSTSLKEGSSYCPHHHSKAYCTPCDDEIDFDLNGVDTNTVEIDPLADE